LEVKEQWEDVYIVERKKFRLMEIIFANTARQYLMKNEYNFEVIENEN